MKALRSLLVMSALALGLLLLLARPGCSSKDAVASDPDYIATCHGPPLKGAEEYEKAQEAGYDINPKWKCITIESYAYIETRRKLEAEAAAKRGEEK